jgi:hypothetical protein
MNDFEKAYMNDYATAFFPPEVGSLFVPPEQRAEGNMARQKKQEQLATAASDMAAGLVKGVATGVAGLPGDLLAIGRGVFEIARRGADQSVADAFLQGLDEGLVLPTSEDISKWLDKNVSPVVPQDQGTVVPTQLREDMANIGQFVGELAAPSGYIKGAKAAIRGSKSMASKAKKVMSETKQGVQNGN